jgi:hypothetical protein
VPGARLKRWKVGSTNRTIAKQQEALIKTDLMMGTIKSEHVQEPTSFDAHTECYLAAPEIKKQAVYTWKKQAIKGRLLPVFGGKLVTTITPGMIEEYRATRSMEKGLLGRTVKSRPSIVPLFYSIICLTLPFAMTTRRRIQSGW